MCGYLKAKKILLGVVALDVWVRISLHSSPMLLVNCHIFHDVCPTPPLVVFEPTPLIKTHQFPAHMQYNFRQEKDGIGTILGLIHLAIDIIESGPV
jgi:hypothetical protein